MLTQIRTKALPAIGEVKYRTWTQVLQHNSSVSSRVLTSYGYVYAHKKKPCLSMPDIDKVSVAGCSLVKAPARSRAQEKIRYHLWYLEVIIQCRVSSTTNMRRNSRSPALRCGRIHSAALFTGSCHSYARPSHLHGWTGLRCPPYTSWRNGLHPSFRIFCRSE